ncbi:response regulator [Plasticicumulans acidivorans]|uniref:Two-component system chemotaxis response regulator CheY n=1 Tax=Plasticicumulans acidivorans TaxID=886464 RepID=A0A317MSN8_9GAMM|nr:response regulator [Plasticicumulans acidivorans]PWV60219.1 two-component system chemotaxis response regulator CheY [Plasticicumulans acidivorans]
MAKSILIIDDSASMRQVVAMTLNNAGYDTVEACDGEDALGKLDGRKFHLMICDVNMPRLDGLGFVRAVKDNPQYKFTPIVMLTTEAGDDKKAQGQAVGARAWVVKPFQPPQLLAAVAKLALP